MLILFIHWHWLFHQLSQKNTFVTFVSQSNWTMSYHSEDYFTSWLSMTAQTLQSSGSNVPDCIRGNESIHCAHALWHNQDHRGLWTLVNCKQVAGNIRWLVSLFACTVATSSASEARCTHMGIYHSLSNLTSRRQERCTLLRRRSCRGAMEVVRYKGLHYNTKGFPTAY